MTRSERIASAVILVGLLCIGGAVGVYRLRSGVPSNTLVSLLPGRVPAGWRRSRQAEEYPADRLNEKINGEDMVYLKRGCLGLAWSAYVSRADEQMSVRISIYDMADAANARSIYEYVRGAWGPELEAVDIGDEAYMVLGSIFFRSGRYYVKLQGSADEPAVSSACKIMATEIAKGMGRAVR